MQTEIRVTIDTGDKARADRFLSAATEKLGDKARLMGVIGEALLDATLTRFRNEEDPSGAKWKPLAPLTLALRKGSSILRLSGRLMGSLHYNVSGSTLELGPAPLPYARIHQEGGVIAPKAGKALAVPFKAGFRGKDGKRANRPGVIFLKKVTIPARPYVGFGKKDEDAVRDAVTSWLGEI